MAWAGRVLAAAEEGLGRTPEIDAAVELAGDRDRRSRGSEVFGLVRGRGIEAGEHPTEQQRLLVRLAELVGEVAHNEAVPPPFYDHHAGWQIGPIAVRLAHAAPDPAVRDRIAAALGDWPAPDQAD
ncbi:hypothetical protein QQM39_04595 [Streptomyces sp. DT2A-34]|uniref:hypothetical protein n=1 Tax=Streptomyces sp. DT2A-34 TaxID=3051182 RepID=UPI00265BB24D|nr:hypothetical protein [Streptomyces sp. DT2A-34]MDO0910164.1 hypothetical protein [Streptomyces sp. DT2A-34]